MKEAPGSSKGVGRWLLPGWRGWDWNGPHKLSGCQDLGWLNAKLPLHSWRFPEEVAKLGVSSWLPNHGLTRSQSKGRCSEGIPAIAGNTSVVVNGAWLVLQIELGRLSVDSKACIYSQTQSSHSTSVGLSLPSKLLQRALRSFTGNLSMGGGVFQYLSGPTGHSFSANTNSRGLR